MNPYFERKGVAIYYGNCHEVCKHIAVPAIVTDPPYGINHSSHGQRFRDAKPIGGDGGTQEIEWVASAFANIPVVCFFSPYAIPQVKWRSVLVWSKGAHTGIGGDRATCWKRDFELIGVKGNSKLAGKRDSAVLNFRGLGKKPTGHFCEKPVDLMQYLIWKIGEKAIVDPFVGSGTTLIAAMRNGVSAIGIESDEKWCEIAAMRIESEPLMEARPYAEAS